MHILPKTRITILLAVVLGVTALLGVFIFILLKENQEAAHKAAAADRMIVVIFERRILAEEYSYARSERARSQWLSKHRSLEELINEESALFAEPGERELLEQIRESVAGAQAVFQDLADLYKRRASSGNGAETFLSEQITLLSSHLSVKAQEAVSAASMLRDMNAAAAAAAFRRIIILFALGGAAFLAVLLACFAEIWRNTRTIAREKAESQAMLAGIGDGVVAIDTAWTITLWNKAAEELTGWSATEALGKPFRELVRFIRERDRAENFEFIREVMLTGEVGRMENGTLLVRKDNTEIPVGDSAAPLFDPDGKVAGCIVIFRDVSKELENRGLKSDFAYASHQMRTPVTKALWALESVATESEPGKVKAAAAQAHRALESVRKLVTKLLEVSNIDQGTVAVEKKSAVPADLINEVIAQIKPEADAKGVSTQLSVADGMPAFATDPEIFKKMLFEVLDNAVEYAGGAKKAEVRARAGEDGLLIEVRNEGPGISEEQQSLVFTKFFRGSNVDTTATPGAGLGLYIAREYARILGGKVWFTSEQSAGTAFFILLPF